MKKIAITLCAIVLVIVAGVLPAFASELPLPTYPQSNVNLSTVTRADAENIISIVTDMRRAGTLNSLRPLFVRRLTTGSVALYCCQQIYNPHVDLSGENVNIGNLSVYQFYLTREGFSFSSYIGQSVVPTNQVIASFSDSGGSINTWYDYVEGEANATISEAKHYWTMFITRLQTDASVALQQAYDEGKRVGYDEGKADGYDEGFFWGKDEGFIEGFQSGKAQGEANVDKLVDEAYDEGYDYGYGKGYEKGVRDQADNEGQLLDIPAIFDGIFSGANSILKGIDIELFGINVLGVLIALLVIAIVAFVVRKLWK